MGRRLSKRQIALAAVLLPVSGLLRLPSEDVGDLAGRKVATPFSSTSHHSLLAALDRSGVDTPEVDLLDLEPQDIVAAWSRGDIDAAYVWLPPLDLGVASTAFIEKQPEVITAWRKAQAQALDLIHDDTSAAAEAVGKQLGSNAQDAAAQLKQGIFLKPAEQADDKWLGLPGRVGGLAQNLHSAAEFLVGQKQIPAAPELSELEKAVYVEGLSDAVSG